ncbi:TIR domain-containing protein [Dokdonella sp.]|uniref:TIR domain-containing protein n=1 Tax=Dokdonella sp. TaxID=2291710 RepID=UPI0031CC063A|nr:TIR domain-containing protein [Dokdonella sp.]
MLLGESAPGFRYWAFISYSHQDDAWGRWLQRAIETYRVPRRLVGEPIAAGQVPARLLPVFRDREELPTAADLGRAVAEALQQSWCLIVICSPAAAASRWVNEEIREFQRLGRAGRIHCLVVDGEPTIAESCFPAALQGRRGSGAGQPIAADPRRRGGGREHARLQLVAGILGVSYDRLAQREHQRRYRRMAAFAGTAVLALAVLAAFTVATISARHEADAQRAHAESLVEFMLGDLRHKLEPEGQLATLDAVGKAALAYYEAQDPASLDADALGRRARALHLIGEVYDQRGELDAALQVFRQAAASTGELLARDGSIAQRIFDHAQSVFWVGLIAFQRGQDAEAETAFKAYLALARRLVGLAPGQADWQAELEYAHSNLGTLLWVQGHVEAAATEFEQALEVAQALALREPDDPSRQSQLAQAHAWLAEARVLQGRLQEAADQRRLELSIYQGMLARDAKNRDATSGAAVAERELGRLAYMRGDLPLAHSLLRHAVALAEALLQADPANMAIMDRAAITYADLGEVLSAGTDVAAAHQVIEREHELASQLAARDATVVQWQARLGRSLLLQAGLQARAGDPRGALRLVQSASQRLAPLRRAHRLDRGTRLLDARTLLLASDLHARLGEPDQARDDLAQLVDLLGADASAGPSADAIQAIALLQLGRTQDAIPLMTRLAAMGYRAPDYVAALARATGPPAPDRSKSVTRVKR